MPRILLSTAYIVPQVLESLGIEYTAKDFPPIPPPFRITTERMEKLKGIDLDEYFQNQVEDSKASAPKVFCEPWKGVITGEREIQEAIKEEKERHGQGQEGWLSGLLSKVGIA